MEITPKRYKVTILRQNGETLDLSQFLLSGSWSDSAGELAARASLTFSQKLTEKGYLNLLLKLCTPIFLYVDGAEVFRGVIWEWDYLSGSTRQATITAYDHLIYAQQSKENSYYSPGLSTQAIVQDICTRWGIPLQYTWNSFSHPKIKYSGRTVAEEILETLDEAAKKQAIKYTAFMDHGVLLVKPWGSNDIIYYFTVENTVSVQNRLSLAKLVTKVLIVGTQENEGRDPVEAVATGDIKYGVLQEFVRHDSNTTFANAQIEAAELLRKRGKPEDIVTLKAPDIPAIRKGDKIKVDAGNIKERYLHVRGATHDIASQTMTLECEA